MRSLTIFITAVCFIFYSSYDGLKTRVCICYVVFGVVVVVVVVVVVFVVGDGGGGGGVRGGFATTRCKWQPEHLKNPITAPV